LQVYIDLVKVDETFIQHCQINVGVEISN